jgi:hypothetical protein
MWQLMIIVIWIEREIYPHSTSKSFKLSFSSKALSSSCYYGNKGIDNTSDNKKDGDSDDDNEIQGNEYYVCYFFELN